MLRKIEILSSAKVNLCLEVKGTDDNGFHLLDSVVAPIPIYDRITITKRKDNLSSVAYVSGQVFVDDVANKMLNLIRNEYGLPGIDVLIDKQIPVGAGLGGSSADAAGIARGLAQMFELDVIPSDILMQAGSDVTCMYVGGNLRIQGRGEKVQRIVLPQDLYVSLIIDKNNKLNTKNVFQKYDQIGGETGSVDAFLSSLIPFNSLERAASDLSESIDISRNILYKSGYRRIVMTGSGSSMIGFTINEKAFQEMSFNVDNETHKRNLLHYKFKIYAKANCVNI